MPTAGQSGDQPLCGSLYGDDDILTPRLPIAHRLADDVWIERFVPSFEALADRLGTGRFVPEQLASCTAEEMALHLVIDRRGLRRRRDRALLARARR